MKAVWDTGYSRRDVLRLLAGAGIGAWLPGSATAASDGSPAPGDLIRRTIPATGERIPVAGMGTYRTFDIASSDTDAMARMRGVLRRFLAGGGRVIDSSPMYGNSEAIVGKLAEDLDARRRLWFATKVWTRGREAGIRQMKRSLARFGVQRLELMQVHNLLDLDTHMQTLRRWKDEGRVRYIGVTHYTSSMHDELARIVSRYPVDFVQFNYSVAEPDAERRLLPVCMDQGIATLINEPFDKGYLFTPVRGKPLPGWAAEIGCRTWAQLFLKYLIGHPGVTCVIPATGNPVHAEENVAAGHGALPTEPQRRRIRAAVGRAG